jgi:hypothetical protein
MRLILSTTTIVGWLLSSSSHQSADAFLTSSSNPSTINHVVDSRRILSTPTIITTTTTATKTQLYVSIGLGPEKKMEEEGSEEGEEDSAVAAYNEKREWVAGVDYEIPDHESYRLSRRSKLDEQCDKWFGTLLGSEHDKGILGQLADDARTALLTPVPLVNDVSVVL